MVGISIKAAGKLENKNDKFQGQPLDDDLGVNWYGFKWRNHDPQIGRFIQIDPLSEEYVHNSSYAFSENKVTNHVELEGLEAVPVAGDPRSYLAEGFAQITRAGANLIDRASSFFVSVKTEIISTIASSKSSIVATTSNTLTLGTNISGWVLGSNTSSVPLFKSENKSDSKIEVKTDMKIGPALVSGKTNINGSTTDVKVEASGIVNGLPLTGSISLSSNNQTGETKVAGKLATGTSTTKGFGQVEITNKGTTSISAGVEQKANNMKQTTSIGKTF